MSRAGATAAAAASACALLAAGCGGEPDGGGASTPGTGRELFTGSGCGSCHVLAAAGARGQVGPDLDRLEPTERDVARQVRGGGGSMPPFRDELSSEEIQAVARYVARAAAGRP